MVFRQLLTFRVTAAKILVSRTYKCNLEVSVRIVPKIIWLMEMSTKRTHSAVGTSRIRLSNWSEEEVHSFIGFLMMHTTSPIMVYNTGKNDRF